MSRFANRVLLALVLLAGCAVASASAGELSGNWSGNWKSCTTGHKGPLKARFCQVDDTHVRATFRGRFWVAIPFRYSVTLTVVGQEGDKTLLEGSSRLGPLLGTFTYHAEATATDFVAHYCARNDHGTFVLSRDCGK